MLLLLIYLQNLNGDRRLNILIFLLKNILRSSVDPKPQEKLVQEGVKELGTRQN